MSRIDISAASLTPVEIQILLALVEGPRHGYGVRLAVEERTQGRMVLGSGTLYVAVQRLEKAGLIKSGERRPASAADRRRRRNFRLTPAGRAALKRELLHLDDLLEHARSLRLLGDPDRA